MKEKNKNGSKKTKLWRKYCTNWWNFGKIGNFVKYDERDYNKKVVSFYKFED